MDRVKRYAQDIAIALAVVGGILALVTVLAWNWPPMVVIESPSMMHTMTGHDRGSGVYPGRIGTIDPGDLVAVRAVGGVDDIETLAERGRNRYGAPGDVILFYVNNDRMETPKIHRALTYVEVEGVGTNRTYRAHLPQGGCGMDGTRDGEWCVYGANGVPMEPFAYYCRGQFCSQTRQFHHSGYLTQGDNNDAPDQVLGISPGLVREEWIIGKARGELPWIGLVKLAVAPQINYIPNDPDAVRIGNAYAPRDLWMGLGLSLAILVLGPAAFDTARAIRARRTGTDAGDNYLIPTLEAGAILGFGILVVLVTLYNLAVVRSGGLHASWALLFIPLGVSAALVGWQASRGVRESRERGEDIPGFMPSDARTRIAAAAAWGGILLLFAAVNYAIPDASARPTLGPDLGQWFAVAGIGILIAALLLYRSEKRAGTL